MLPHRTLRARRPDSVLSATAATLVPLAALAALAAGACSGTQTAVRTNPVQPPRVNAQATMGDGVLLPDPARMWLAGSEPDGTRYIVVEGLRVTVQPGGAVAFGTDRFATPINLATRAGTGAGWIFVAADGAIGASDSFLGPLRPLGELPQGQRVMNSQGRLVLLDSARGVFSTDGSAPLARMANMPPGGVLDAEFVTARFGAVVINGGQVFRTNDGGGTWQPVDLGNDAAWRLSAEGSALVADTTAGRKTINPDGTLSPAAPRPSTPPNPNPANTNPATPTAAGGDDDAASATHPPLAPPDAAPVRAALLRRYPSLLTGDVAVTAPDGNLLAVVGGLVVLVDPRTGRTVREVDAAPSADGCRIEPWGSAIGAQCTEQGATMRYTGDGAWPVGRNEPMRDVVFSSDGRHAAGIGACAPALAPQRAGTPAPGADDDTNPLEGRELCALSDPNGGWHRLAFHGREPHLLAMHGAQLLLSVARADPDDSGLRVIDTERGAVRRLALMPGVDPRTVAVRSAGFTSDGRVVGVAAWRLEQPDPDAEDDDEDTIDEDDDTADAGAAARPSRTADEARPRGPVPPAGGLMLLYGALDQPLTLRSLPVGAESVGFVDGVRGVAAGADVRQMWRTEDGGQSWQLEPLAVVGPVKAVTFNTLDASGVPAVRCARTGCVVGGRVWFPADRAAQSLDGRVLAGRDPRAAVDAPEDDDAAPGQPGPIDVNAGRYVCAAPASPLPSLLRVTAGLRRNALRRSLVAPGVNAVLDAWAERGGVRLQLQWRGTDTQGAFSGATVAGEPQLADVASDTTPWRAPSYTLWGAARGGAVLERCAAPSWRACQVVWAQPRGTLSAIADATAFATGGNVNVESVTGLPGGGFAVLTTMPADPGSPTVASVTVLGPDGRVQARRGFAFLGARAMSVARFHGATGLAAATGSDGRTLDFFAVAPGAPAASVRLPTIPSGALALCGAPVQSPDLAELFATYPAFVPQIPTLGAGLSTSSTIEITGGRACVRAVRAFAPGRRGTTGSVAAPRGVQLSVGNDGRLSGFSDDGALTSLLQCNRQP